MPALEIGCGAHRSDVDVSLDLDRSADCDIQGDGHTLPFKDKSFHVVHLYETLEHVEYPLRLLREIHRVMEDDGILSMSIPNLLYFGRFVKWLLNKPITVSEQHIFGWGLPELTNLLRFCGFTVEASGTMERGWNHKRNFGGVFKQFTEHSLHIVARKKKKC